MKRLASWRRPIENFFSNYLFGLLAPAGKPTGLNIMNRSVQQLMYALQTLALPVTAQLRLHPCDGCRVEELALSFDRWQHQAQGALNDNLTSEQMEALNRLDQKLLKLSGSPGKPAWTELSLRKSAEWREIRNMARAALSTFSWPLDLPPPVHG